MITILDERTFKILNDEQLKETDVLITVKKILNERKEMPRGMELKFNY